MIVAFVTANLFTAGVAFLLAAALYYNAGRRDERTALGRQRASSAAVRARMAALAVRTAAHVKPLPAAQRDHSHSGELHLKPIRKSATAGRN